MPPDDVFDRLPDPLVVNIFNKLCDVKVLGRCCAVSKRFKALVPQVEEVVVKVDCVISAEESNPSVVKGKGVLTHWLRALVGSVMKPLHVLQQYLSPGKKSVHAEVSHHSPGEVLKNFKEVRHLKIELPGGELGIEEGVLLKWRAEFGSTLESCVVLGASSLVNFDKTVGKKCSKGYLRRIEDLSPTEVEEDAAETLEDDEANTIPESFYTNGALKLRVVWTISSLIAASARHFLLQQIISDHPTLESLVLADADGQGTLCMGKQQLRDFRDKPMQASASCKRTQVPALDMKLWYAAFLDLPGGSGMRGATLVAIRPSHQPLRQESQTSVANPFESIRPTTQSTLTESDSLVSSAFEEPFNSAASSLARRRTHFLEMKAF